MLWRTPFEEQDEAPATLGVVYEDEHLLVLDKPPLLAVHPTARHHHVTVIKLLQAERPGEFLSLVHRLDRETSGLLMIARSREADRAFKRLLEDRSVLEARRAVAARAAAAGGDAGRALRGVRPSPVISKVYLAITHGTPPSGVVDSPLEPDPASSLRVKMRAAPVGRGLEARTGVTVLDSDADYALVECRLLTGRQHQIRVHLAALGCPLVGDKLYGPDESLLARAADGQLTEADLATLILPRHALHAHRYALPHAITGAPLELVSPLPLDLAAFWNEQRGSGKPAPAAD